MKAAMFYGRRDLRLDEILEPETRAGSVKARVERCGICGSDLHEYLAGPIFAPLPDNPLSGDAIPITFGHEFCGEVIEVGSDVEGISPGTGWPSSRSTAAAGARRAGAASITFAGISASSA